MKEGEEDRRYGNRSDACATSDDFQTVADTSRTRAVTKKTTNDRRRRRRRHRFQVKPMPMLNSKAAAAAAGKGATTTKWWSVAAGLLGQPTVMNGQPSHRLD